MRPQFIPRHTGQPIGQRAGVFGIGFGPLGAQLITGGGTGGLQYRGEFGVRRPRLVSTICDVPCVVNLLISDLDHFAQFPSR